MAVDAFIWFEEPASGKKAEGETQDQMYSANKAFEIKDFSFGIENPTTGGSATGGFGAGKVKFNEFTIKKTTDSASPAFFTNCCCGSHYPSVTIAIRKSGGSNDAGTQFLLFKFSTVFTTKIDWTGPGEDAPEESITFVFGKLGINYFPQDKAGKMGTPIPAGWDQLLNKDATADYA